MDQVKIIKSLAMIKMRAKILEEDLFDQNDINDSNFGILFEEVKKLEKFIENRKNLKPKID